MKYSNRRTCIYEIIKSAKNHPTAEMIYSEVRKKIPNISLGTVYRNLNLLVGHGYIRKIIGLDECVHYDNTFKHDHMRCLECGNIIDLTADMVPMIDRYVEEKSGNQILSHELLLTGICKKCRKKEKK